MDAHQQGVDRLKALLQGLVDKSKSPFQGGSIPPPNPPVPSTGMVSMPFPLAGPSLASPMPAFDYSSFSSHHRAKLALVKRLMQEQQAVELDLLAQFEDIQAQLAKLRSGLEALEIIQDVRGLADCRAAIKMAEARQQKHVEIMQATMQSLMLKQQQLLAAHGFPLFKPSLEREALTNMMWVLQPYLAELAHEAGS
ncbi:hypothetical protein HDV03_002791 [Kappamyces sp. JEL0829]|nr:hypothetical protein HDV03_002791 [Kappamyces sp. JEL0829]